MIADKEIEELRKNIYYTISLLQDKDEIINALPTPSYANFFPLIDGIIELLNNDIEEYNKWLKDLDENSDDYYDVSVLLENTKLKIEICNKLKNEACKEKNVTDVVASDRKIDFIFAKSGFNKIKFRSELTSISQEKYSEIHEFLEMIRNRQNFNNIKKIRRLTGPLDGIWEAKPFGVRILFKFLNNNTVYIFGIKEKKSNNDSIDRNQILEKYSSCRFEYDQLAKEIILRRDELIAEHIQYKDEIYDYLKAEARGNRKFGK